MMGVGWFFDVFWGFELGFGEFVFLDVSWGLGVWVWGSWVGVGFMFGVLGFWLLVSFWGFVVYEALKRKSEWFGLWRVS